jgi:hypothetical protein
LAADILHSWCGKGNVKTPQAIITYKRTPHHYPTDQYLYRGTCFTLAFNLHDLAHNYF